jgi:hypothetical protein
MKSDREPERSWMIHHCAPNTATHSRTTQVK